MSAKDDLQPWEKYAVLFGSGMTSSKRGLQQLANALGLKHSSLGTDDAGMKDIDYEQKAIEDLQGVTPGGWAANMAGSFADPSGLIPGALAVKGVKGLRALRNIAATGALSSGVGEEKADDSRLGNMALGAAMNAVLPAATVAKEVWAGAKGAKNIPSMKPKFEKIEEAAKLEGRGYSHPDVVAEAEKMGLQHGIADPDKPWVNPYRFWISHEADRMTPGALAMKVGPDPQHAVLHNATLGGVLNSPATYNAYPQLTSRPTKVTLAQRAERGGSLSRNTNTGETVIKVHGDSAPTTYPSLVHEIQHDVDGIEGWPRGSSPDTMDPKVGPARSFHAYLGSPGETNARDSAARAVLEQAGRGDVVAAHKWGELHDKVQNAPSFVQNMLYDPLHSTSDLAKGGILRGTPEGDTLAAALNDPRQFHKYPVHTRKIPDVPEAKSDDISELSRYIEGLKQNIIWHRTDAYGNPVTDF
jgi:hypothetical protein